MVFTTVGTMVRIAYRITYSSSERDMVRIERRKMWDWVHVIGHNFRLPSLIFAFYFT